MGHSYHHDKLEARYRYFIFLNKILNSNFKSLISKFQSLADQHGWLWSINFWIKCIWKKEKKSGSVPGDWIQLTWKSKSTTRHESNLKLTASDLSVYCPNPKNRNKKKKKVCERERGKSITAIWSDFSEKFRIFLLPVTLNEDAIKIRLKIFSPLN